MSKEIKKVRIQFKMVRVLGLLERRVLLLLLASGSQLSFFIDHIPVSFFNLRDLGCMHVHAPWLVSTLPLPDKECSSVGCPPSSECSHCALGMSAISQTQETSQQRACRVVIGQGTLGLGSSEYRQERGSRLKVHTASSDFVFMGECGQRVGKSLGSSRL